MAINLNQRYSSDNAPTSPDYPFGRGINAVNDQDETSLPFDMDWFNDWSGFFQAVLMAANITPSGTSDTARTSQYLAALRVLFPDQTEADLRYARRSQNLSDLASVSNCPNESRTRRRGVVQRGNSGRRTSNHEPSGSTISDTTL